MGHADYYKKGDWNHDCMRCGFKFKASELHYDHGRRGMGNTLLVCKECLDKPQMQDYVKGLTDKQTVPHSYHPEPVFVTVPVNPYED